MPRSLGGQGTQPVQRACVTGPWHSSHLMWMLLSKSEVSWELEAWPRVSPSWPRCP